MKLKSIFSYAAALLLALNISAHAGDAVDPDANYDRLDGMGQSGKRVDVIEWEGNLEIHVYPKGSTAGLGLKIDDKNGQKVMVIAYRFVESPKKVLTRRNILGIPMSNQFKVFKDPTEDEFDKFIISNNGLSGQVVAFKLDPTPTNLYPEGTAVANQGSQNTGRAPASAPASQSGAGYRDTTGNAQPSGPDDNGSLPAFFMQDRGNSKR